MESTTKFDTERPPSAPDTQRCPPPDMELDHTDLELADLALLDPWKKPSFED